jgi:hypothetical protein
MRSFMRTYLAAAVLVPWIASGQTTAPTASPAPATAKPAAKAAAASKTWVQPKTPWGDPDIQGMWPGVWGVPLQRPANVGYRATLTNEELAARQAQAAKQAEVDRQEFASPNDRIGIGPPSYWTERGHPGKQTSLIIDPPDGHIPPMTPEAKAITAATPADWKGVANSPEDINIYIRCITRGVIGTILPSLYDNGNQIVQAPGYVVLRQEMIHETRVIPLDGRAHAGQNIRMYMGDSRGHWEGNTLVVETTNFTDKTVVGNNGVAYGGQGGRNSQALKLVERFKRVDANTLNYSATIEDTKTWTKPWTIAFPLERDDNYGFYEYACHEGNYAMKDILSGARAMEQSGRGQEPPTPRNRQQ